MLAKPLEPKQATGCCSHHLQQLRLPLTTLVLSRGHPLYRTEGTWEHLTQRPDSSLARPGTLALPAPVCARHTHPHAGVRQGLHGSLEPEPMVLRPHGQALRLSAAHSQQPGMGKADKLSPRLGHGLGPELTLLVSHGGHFEQDAHGKWTYKGGVRSIETVRTSLSFHDLSFRWSEKVNSDFLYLKYKLPEDDLDPDNLITVREDTDLQEMVREYFGGLAKSKGTSGYRLGVYLYFDNTQEPLTPAEYQDGYNFFKTSSMSRMADSRSYSIMPPSSLGSNNSMESVKTAAQREPQQRFLGLTEQEREAAALVEWLHAQEQAGMFDKQLGTSERQSTREEELGMFTLEDSAFLPMQPSDAEASGADEKPVWRTQDKLIEQLATSPQPRCFVSGHTDGGGCATRVARPAQPDIEVPIDEKLPSQLFGSPAQPGLPWLYPAQASQDGVHLPSNLSAFGKGHTLHLAHLMEERCAELAAQQREYAAAELAAKKVNAYAEPKDATMHQGSVGLDTQASGSQATSLLNVSVHRVPLSAVKKLAEIGTGAFGEVWLGHNSTFGKVAVKTIKPDDGKDGKKKADWAETSIAFWREAEMLGSLNHPNVLRVYGVVVVDPPAGAGPPGSLGSPGSPLDRTVVGIMTEYMRGGSLSSFLAQLYKLKMFIPLKMRAELALGAVKGLAYLHDMNVVHFDLKPENLLLDGVPLNPYCPCPVVKVADFGLSTHKLKHHVPGVSGLRGTLPYMAPELVTNSRAVSEKVDVWSLGTVLWEMLTLQRPYHELSGDEIMRRLMSCKSPDIPWYSEGEWTHLMDRCWEPDPQGRCSLREMAESLQRIIDEPEDQVLPPATPQWTRAA